MQTVNEKPERLKHVQARAEAFLNQNPDAAKIIPTGDVRDLIEDLQAALHESRDTIQAIIDASTESVLLVDPKGTVLAINATAALRLGRSMEEALGQNVYDFFDPDVSNNRRVRLHEVIASRQPVHFVDERSGKRYHHSLYPVCDPKGTVEKVAIFGQDVTLQYQAMNDLLESESKYRLVVDHATIGIVVTQDGQLKFVNPQAVKLAGYSKVELTSRPFVDFIHPDDRAMVMEYHVRRLKGQEVPETYNLRIVSQDGQIRWLENKGVLITWDDKPATLNFLADISERKQDENLIRNLSQMLMQAQERERRMIAYELHDRIAQNLSTLKLEADMLFAGPAGSLPELKEKSGKFSMLIESTIKSVRDLAYDLRPPGLDQMGLEKALEMYCEEFSQTSRMNIDFQAAGMQGFNLDTDTQIHIYRLVQEGLNNIRKHAAAGRAFVKLLGASPNIILRIEDEGKGFDVLARELALDSEKRMGLRSMKERVNLLHGRMEIQSRPMQGTKIVIKLPLMEHSGESEEAHPDY